MIGPEKYFKMKKGVLHAENVSIESIIKWTGSPVYIYSKNAIVDSINQLKRHLKGLDYLICFAAKANSNLAILKVIQDCGAGVDIVSGGELFRAKKVGFAASKIVFSGVGKTVKEMQEALKYKGGIYSFNVESIAELARLESVAKSMRKTASVSLRFNPNINARTHPYISTGLKENKFGLNRQELKEALQNFSHSPWIRIKGLSIHIGSQMLKLGPLDEAYREIKKVRDQVEAATGSPIEFLDLGGGFGIDHTGERAPTSAAIGKLIKKHFSKENNLRIVIEPGRSIVGNAGILVTQVQYRKQRAKKDFLIVDAGMNDFIRPALYQGEHLVRPLKKSGRGKNKKTDIVGPVCESADFLAKDRALSTSLNSGNYLALLSTGAYGSVLSSHYNDRPRIPEVMVSGKLFRIIRKGQKYSDLTRGEFI